MFRAFRVLNALHCTLRAGAAGLALIGVAATVAAAGTQQVIDFDIQAQKLSTALLEFSTQAKLQVLTATDSVVDLEAPAVRGRMAATDAMARLLQGTKLTFHAVGDNAIAIDGDRVAQSDGLPRLAQSEPSPESARPAEPVSGGEQLEEIVVTAQKKMDRLQDVPVPVSVVNTDALADSGKVLIKDYFSSIPGLSFQPTILGTSNVSIRGISTSGFTNPTVGVMVDDVPYGASTQGLSSGETPDFDPGDLSRVEVLRGPQGTLYGANSMGGLLKFVTKDPSTKGFGGRIETGVSEVRNGAQPGYTLRGSVNLPLGETLAIRASAFTRQDPGYIDNPITQIKGVNEAQNEGARIAALWGPSQDFSLKLSALYQRSKVQGGSQVDILPGLADLQQTDLKDSGGYDRKVQAYSATLNYKIHGIDLTSVTGYNIGRTFNTIDYTWALGGGPGPDDCCTYGVSRDNFGVAVTGTEYANQFNVKKLTQELRAHATMGPVELLLGGFYTHESAAGSNTVVYAEDAVTAKVAGVLLRQFYSGPSPHFEEYAGFANLTYHVTDKLDIQFGGRESWDREIDTPQINTGPFVPILDGVTTSTFVVPQIAANGDAFTYLVTPRLKISSDLMIYARVASGYRPGTPNATSPERLAQGVPLASNPDKSQNYEVGVKADFVDHRLSVDASLFHIDWKDIQLQLLDRFGAAYAANGGAAKSDGVELAVAARPLHGLSVSAWVDYTNAVLKEDMPGNSSVVGLSGDRLPLSSRFSGNIAVEQDFAIRGDLIAFAGGEVSYVGDRLGQFQDTAARQGFPGYTKTDLLFGVKNDLWKVSLYANNLLDKRGLLNGGVADLYNPYAFLYIPPRTIGLSAVRNF